MTENNKALDLRFRTEKERQAYIDRSWIDASIQKPKCGEPVMALLDNGEPVNSLRYFAETDTWTHFDTPYRKRPRKGMFVTEVSEFPPSFVRRGATTATHWQPIPPAADPKPNKDTPTAPFYIHHKETTAIHCPNCDKDLAVCGCGRNCKIDFNFCPYCRQALDMQKNTESNTKEVHPCIKRHGGQMLSLDF